MKNSIQVLFILAIFQISCTNQKTNSIKIDSIFDSNWELDAKTKTTGTTTNLIYNYTSKEIYKTGDGIEEREEFQIIEKTFNSPDVAKEYYKSQLTECEFEYASILGNIIYLYKDNSGMSRRSNMIYIKKMSSEIRQVNPFAISNGHPIFFSEIFCYR